MGKPVIGLIANPASGRDIRRLVAHASVIDNIEKANIVKRIIVTLEALGVSKMIVMPETFGITERAISMLPKKPSIDIEFIDMRVRGDWLDTYYAANYMKGKVDAIISIGGDGTNRIIAKTDIEAPVMPISTGTNNVFPYMIEATIAAAAAAVVALGVVPLEEATFKSKRVEVWRNGELADIALVDAAPTVHQFVGSRAIWKPEFVREVVSCLCAPYNIGLSSIPGVYKTITHEMDEGMYVRISPTGKERVCAPIAPGFFRSFNIGEHRLLKIGEHVEIRTKPSIIALDGERELWIHKGDDVIAVITRKGLRVVDYRKALKLASKKGFFEDIAVKKPL